MSVHRSCSISLRGTGSSNLPHGGVSERPKEHASKACNGVTRSWVRIPPPPLVVVRERSLSGRWRTTSRTLIVVRLVACGEEMGSRAHPLIGPAHRSRCRWIDPADCSALAQRSCARPSVPALVWETGQGWTVKATRVCSPGEGKGDGSLLRPKLLPVGAFGKDHVTQASNFDTGVQDAAEVMHRLAPSGSMSLSTTRSQASPPRPGFVVGPRIG
jgi:hypothetical protein